MSLNHPPKDQLIAFGQGKLADDESSLVEQHLEVCSECCETLLDLKDDTFVGLVRIAQPDDAVAEAVRVRTENATEAKRVGHDSEHAATLLVQSGETIAADKLPAELREHPRYRIVELIGRGGMGNVYRAEHRLMNRWVAIKLINAQLVERPQAVERFRREVQAAAKLSHPNIVAAFDAEQAGSTHFLVMEFVEGTDLATVVQQRGPMSVVQACDCVQQAAKGLQHAHEKGMVHRDIKPHNLMLSAEGHVRILDFGLAGFATESAFDASGGSPLARREESRTSVDAASAIDAEENIQPAARDRQSSRGARGLLSQLTAIGTVMGTPDYIAPEQVQDAHAADIRADIYSLGCTLHFLLTGRPPFVADNVIEKLKAHAERAPESLTKLRSDVPQELSQVVARMMAKNPAERFQTPAAVAEALAPFAKPAASPPKRRVRTLVAAMFLALLAGVIFVQTDKGRIEVQSEVNDVKVSIKQRGKEIDVIDLQTSSRVRWLPSGTYDVELKDDRNDVEIINGGFKLMRWGKEIVTLKRKPDSSGLAAKAEWKGWPKDAPPPAIAPFNADQAKQHQEAWARHLGVPVEYTNSIGMKFHLIPPGEFRMGSTSVEIEAALATKVDEIWKEHIHSEGPQHHVILTQPLYLGVYEVTQAEYEQVMGKNPSSFAATGAGKDAVAGLDTTRHPAEMVNWTDASEFCTKLSEKEQLQPFNFELGAGETVMTAGTGYRLPTEAEWEFACRAGTTTRFWIGDQDKSLFPAGWFNMNSDDRAQTVGKLQGNPFGLYDIHGNVWEWVRDWWEPTYYGQFQDKPALDPSGPSSAGSRRVIRGGEWNSDASRCRASFRHAFDPSKRHVGIGFRVSLPIGAVRKAIDKSAKMAKTAPGDSPLASLKDSAAVLMYLNDPRNNRGGSVPVALLGREGRVAFRFGTWLVVFEGIACDPKATILGFSNFNVPQPGSSGEGTIDFGAGDKLPGVLIKSKFFDEQNEISINNHRFKLRGKATRLEFGDKAYDATNSLQTILVGRDGSTRLAAAPATPDAIVEVGRFTGHEGSASHAIVSPGGRYGISCGSDKTIRVWDIATQEEKRVLRGHEGSVFGLAISTDGKLLASGDNAKSIRLWNMETGEQVGELTGHTDAVSDLVFMPDRTHLLSAGFDGTLRLWHVVDRKLVKTIDIGTNVEKMLTLTDDRRVMLSGAHTRGWGPTTYDLEKGEKIAEIPSNYCSMAVSTDGRLSLVGSITGVLVVTDTVNGKVLVQMTDPRVNVARDRGAFDAAITPDGRFAITTTREGHMYLWDLHGGKLLSSAEGDTIGTITLSPDGRFALTIGQGGISVWRLPESVLEPIAATGPRDEAPRQTEPRQPR